MAIKFTPPRCRRALIVVPSCSRICWCSNLFIIVLLLLVGCCCSSYAYAAPAPLVTPSYSQIHTTTPPEETPSKRSANVFPYQPMYLISKDSQTLEVLPNKTVRGSTEMEPYYGLLQLSSQIINSSDTNFAETSQPIGFHNEGWLLHPEQVANNIQVISIKGVRAELYVCMNSKGRVYASETQTDECHFREMYSKDNFNMYYHYKYSGKRQKNKKNTAKGGKKWFLGIRKGRVMKGHRTREDSDYAKFVPKGVREITLGKDSMKPPLTLTTAPTHHQKPQQSPFVTINRNNNKRPKVRNRDRSPFSQSPRARGGRKRCSRGPMQLVFPIFECEGRGGGGAVGGGGRKRRQRGGANADDSHRQRHSRLNASQKRPRKQRARHGRDGRGDVQD